MPDPSLVGSISQGAAAVVGAGVNAISTGRQNRKSREFSEKMYNRQKADNLEFWNLQNSYNSPAAQMQRYKDAGLNPHLIYGQGSNGNAQPVSTPDVQTPQFKTPEWGNVISAAGTGFNDYYDLRLRAAQANNAEAQADIIAKQGDLLDAQTFSTLMGGRDREFDLGMKSDLREVSADYQREKLRQLTTNIDNSIQANARQAISLSTSVAEAGERILRSQSERSMVPYKKGIMLANTSESYQRLRNAQRDGVLKDIDIALRKKGINPGDPQWQRIVGLTLDGIVNGDSPLSLDNIGKSIRDWIGF